MINFVSINTFSTVPIIRYIIEDLSKLDSIRVIHCRIESQPLNSGAVSRELSLGIFKTTSDFNKQSNVFKVIKYLKLYFEVLKTCVNNNQTIITQDYQVISFILSHNYLLSFFKNKLIYYQFELVEYDLIPTKDKKKFRSLIHHVQHIDLAIFPEINRLRYFCNLTNCNSKKTLLIPNTCQPVGNTQSVIPDFLKLIPKGATVFGHIGNVGPDHYIEEFLYAVDQITRPDVYFIMVGRYSGIIKALLETVENPNFIFVDEVPHAQLKNIYPVIHFGLILYKGVDKNFEFCAPNKLYEYWSYGIPVLAHKVAGLVPVIDHDFLGKTLDFEGKELQTVMSSLINAPKPDRKYIQEYFDAYLSVDRYLVKLRSKLQSL